MKPKEKHRPTPQLIKEAQAHPNGWVYKIDKGYTSGAFVPPEGIVGAWKVDSAGNITGDFIPNPNYRPTPTTASL